MLDNEAEDITVIGAGIARDKKLIDKLADVVASSSGKPVVINNASANEVIFTNIPEDRRENVKLHLDLFILTVPEENLRVKNSPLSKEFDNADNNPKEPNAGAVARPRLSYDPDSSFVL